MNEIQIACHTFSLDFYKICDEIDFETDTFCSGFTLAVQEKYKTGENKKSFSWTGSDEQLKKIYDGLIKQDHGFIDAKTDFKDFTAIFAGDVITDNLLPIKWIKQGKNKFINKFALIDLLTLMKIPKSEIEDKDKIKTCFSDDKGNPMIFSGGNLHGNKHNEHSECYPELDALIKSL
jgi:hypothetical protein